MMVMGTPDRTVTSDLIMVSLLLKCTNINATLRIVMNNVFAIRILFDGSLSKKQLSKNVSY